MKKITIQTFSFSSRKEGEEFLKKLKEVIDISFPENNENDNENDELDHIGDADILDWYD